MFKTLERSLKGRSHSNVNKTINISFWHLLLVWINWIESKPFNQFFPSLDTDLTSQFISTLSGLLIYEGERDGSRGRTQRKPRIFWNYNKVRILRDCWFLCRNKDGATSCCLLDIFCWLLNERRQSFCSVAVRNKLIVECQLQKCRSRWTHTMDSLTSPRRRE